jgi:4-amino-4-deoxy-L-arabinose transferase-like glycosyltransferase
VIAALLLGLYAALALSAAAQQSTTFDEIAHITGGASYWLTGDFRLQPENGILPQRWGALPIVLGGYRFPSLEQDAWWNADAWAVGYHFFYDQGNDLATMLLAGRSMMTLVAVALGVLVFAWSRRLFGPVGGLVSLVCYVFCPTMLAHGPLVTSDVTATFFFAAWTWASWRLLHRVSAGTLLAGALALAGLVLSKMSGVLALPVGVALIGIRLLGGRSLEMALGTPRSVTSRPRQLATFALAAGVQVAVVVVALWGAYGFRYSAFQTPPPGRQELAWESIAPVAAPVELARRERVLPEAYLYGFAFTHHYATTRPAFLNGRHSWRGWWWFFPYCLLVKTPPALFAILLLAGATGRWRTYETAPLWILFGVYWAFALTSHLNIGHRHILPTYPPMFVLAGAAGQWLADRRWAPRALVGIALAGQATAAVGVYPHFLAYFNVLAGGPRHGYRHLVDSSLDWGQDLPALKRWLVRNVDASTPVYLSYFGTGSPEFYGVRSHRLPSHFDLWRPRESYALTAGVYAVSATMLQSIYSQAPGPWAQPYEDAYQADVAAMRAIAAVGDQEERARRTRDFVGRELDRFEQLRFARLCAFLRQREPDDEVGYSILVYRLSARDVAQALEGPPAELVPQVAIEGLG